MLLRRFIQMVQEEVALSMLTVLAIAQYVSKESLEGLCEQRYLYTPCCHSEWYIAIAVNVAKATVFIAV